MSELLEHVIEQLKILPADEQDALATRFLAEIKDEKSWKASFASTTDDQWDSLVQVVRRNSFLEITIKNYFHDFLPLLTTKNHVICLVLIRDKHLLHSKYFEAVRLLQSGQYL